MFTVSALIAAVIGCLRYLRTTEPSPYARRLFHIYLASFAAAWTIIELEFKPLFLLLLPILYTVIFLAFELNKAVSQPEIPDTDQIGWGFFKPIFGLAAFCLVLGFYIFATKGA
jgi:hypothetical protein